MSYEQEQLLRLEEEINGFEQAALEEYLFNGKSLKFFLYQVDLHRENFQHFHMQCIIPKLESSGSAQKIEICDECGQPLSSGESIICDSCDTQYAEWRSADEEWIEPYSSFGEKPRKE